MLGLAKGSLPISPTQSTYFLAWSARDGKGAHGQFSLSPGFAYVPCSNSLQRYQVMRCVLSGGFWHK